MSCFGGQGDIAAALPYQPRDPHAGSRPERNPHLRSRGFPVCSVTRSSAARTSMLRATASKSLMSLTTGMENSSPSPSIHQPGQIGQPMPPVGDRPCHRETGAQREAPYPAPWCCTQKIPQYIGKTRVLATGITAFAAYLHVAILHSAACSRVLVPPMSPLMKYPVTICNPPLCRILAIKQRQLFIYRREMLVLPPRGISKKASLITAKNSAGSSAAYGSNVVASSASTRLQKSA